MRYIILLLSVAILSIGSVVADARSETLLNELSSRVDELGRYEVEFDIVMDGDVVDSGEYRVDEDRYKLVIAGQVIYGEGGERLTINAAQQEVVMERVDESLPMVVANPANAFRSLTLSFDSLIEGELDGLIYIQLTPREKSPLIESSTLVIDAESGLPNRVVYLSDGDIIVVEIKKISTIDESIPAIDSVSLPDGYEIIDIR